MTEKLKTKPEDDIFETVRRGFETVAAMARRVKIREDMIPDYAARLPDAPPENVLDEDYHYSGDAESTAAFILTLDSVNFGSGYYPHLVEEGWETIGDSIYFSISTRIKRRFEKDGPVPAEHLAVMGPPGCAAILELGEGPRSAEFAGLCAQSLSELGQTVTGQYDGRYLDMVRAAQGRADNMVRILTQMHHFRDVHSYRGHEIPFYKRAQITAGDLHLAFGRLGETLFGDIGRLTMFPDNGVPHVFRTDGLLEYEPELAARIDAGQEIPSGSEEEIEIRACAGHLVERIAAIKGMIPMTVDHILWHKSVEDPRYREKQPHLTRSRFY